MVEPYIAAAADYFALGWSPIPLPHHEKSPVPDGFTGVAGKYVDEKQLRAWLGKPGKPGRANAGRLNYPPGNIALRLQDDIIGIDVDAHGEKAGEATLAAAEEEWGPLPATVLSTSRTDGISGIRLFRIPPGLAWPGQLPQGGGVELVRWDHRYVIVAPSVHDKTGLVYFWYREVVDEASGTLRPVLMEGEIPEPPELPELPTEWVTGLTSGQKWEARGSNETMTGPELNAWLDERNAPGVLCSHMRNMQTRWSVQVQKGGADGGAHDETRDAVWGALNDAKAGHCGIIKVLAHLKKVFLAAVAGRRADEGAARSEWARIVIGGGRYVTADENEPEVEDPCEALTGSSFGSEVEGSGLINSHNEIPELNQFGNSARLLRVMEGRARWVDGLKSWVIWDGMRWRPDADGQIDRWATKAINQILEDGARVASSADNLKAFKSWHKASSKMSEVTGAIAHARRRKGITVPLEQFDADPMLLGCANGTLVLSREGVTLRAVRPEDYLTHNTGTAYVEGARHPLWDDYLERFQPDPEVREWLQKLVGYSLFGHNAEQLLIVGLGLTGSGKTTFTEGLLKALGGYAGPLDASVLRASGDDKPRPDILKIMAKRFVIAEELSEFQHLHVDQAKRLTGAGTLSARGMNSNTFVERRGAFTPWLMTNEVPTIEGADAALRNRVLVVPFDVQQVRSRESSRIREEIIAEGSQAILAWAVEGWVKYATSAADAGLRSIPAGALEANGKFASGMSEFHTFLSQCCDQGEDFSEVPIRLFEAYENWCAENSIAERERLSLTKFGRRVDAMGYHRERVRADGKQVWMRRGLRLVVRLGT